MDAQLCRLSGSPAAVIELVRIFMRHDILAILPAVRVPTLVLVRSGNPRREAARYLAGQIPTATFVEVPGEDTLIYVGDTDTVLDEVQEFLTGARDAPSPDRVLATVLMTDIVGSTDHASRLGDRRWRELLDAHDSAVDRQLDRFRGRKVNTTGDGMLATFDGPARAVRCAQAILSANRALGLEVRAGVHTGEVELRGADIGGIAVHIGARIAGLAGPGEVLVSRTVTDLVAGSGIEFVDHGEHQLKGVPGAWRLFAMIPEAPSSPTTATSPDLQRPAHNDRSRAAWLGDPALSGAPSRRSGRVARGRETGCHDGLHEVTPPRACWAR